MTETATDEVAEVSAEAAQTPAAPVKRAPQLKTITAIENVVNEYARTVAKKWKLKDDEFVILLSRRFKGIMGLQRGHPVKITLAWPESQPHLNTLLSEAFMQITKHKLVDIWAIEGVAHIRARNVENKKWRREKFGQQGEIIGELIPKKYISVETTVVSSVTQKIRDNVTGIEIEKSYTSATTKNDDGRVLDVKTWLELSRLVRDAEEAEPEDASPDDEGSSSTPEQEQPSTENPA